VSVADVKRLSLALLICSLVHANLTYAADTRLPRSSPEAEGVDSAGVLSLIDALEKNINAVHSIMLLRHGKVVAEGWWAPYVADDAHILYSVTKSFTSTAVGLAEQEGLLSINDKVLSFFPDLAPAEPAPQMKAMRIRDLLKMTSGHQNDTIDRLRATPDGQWRRTFLATAVEHKPGTHFVYNSGGSYMLSAIVQKVSGQTLDSYLQSRLFEPLGISQHPWGLSSEGIALGDGGLSLTTESVAKFGQLYLQKGVWNGTRVLSEKWVELATSRETSNGSDPDSDWDAGYGFQFWRNKTTGYRADGALGQFSFVLPEYDVVLAITSGTSNTKGIMNTVWQHLLPALHASALPSNPPAQAALTQKLSSLSLPVQSGAAHSPRIHAISGATYVFPENEQGISSVQIDFSAANPVITFKDTEGTHPISCGLTTWVRGTTTFRKRISSLWDVDHQGMAATAAWTDDDTFVAKLCFDETPYIITARFKFDGDNVLLDMEHNERWGEKKRPQIVGVREP
jgi:CubicO group peptidase (beta-lactamase class C family)